MNNSNWNITKAAERLKKLYKEHGLNQSGLAQLIGYAPENRANVSKAMNASAFLLQDQYELLAAEWNVRFEYLVGIDDYKTIDDYYNSQKNKALSEYRHIISYLEYLGLKFEPKYYLVTCLDTLYEIATDDFENYKEIAAFFSDDTKKYIKEKTSIKHLSTLSSYDRDAMTENIELMDNPNNALMPLNDIANFDLNDIEINERYNDFSIFLSDMANMFDNDEYSNLEGSITIQYKVFYNGSFAGLRDLLNIQGFFNFVNDICKTSIQSLLVNKNMENGFIYL